jgi:CHAT domain-containing protein/tetratricopeptide (TPR) repeat protein
VAWAVAHAERALRSSPGFAEALFNRALALERLELRTAATRGWADYLRVDARSPWAAEARDHLHSLTAATRQPPALALDVLRASIARGDLKQVGAALQANADRVRGAVWDVLDAWAGTCQGSRCETATLPPVRSVAEALERATTDREPLDWLEALRDGGDQDRLMLAQAYLSQRRGLAQYERYEFEAARASFDASRRLLIAGDDGRWAALALEPALGLAGVVYNAQDFAGARTLLVTIEPAAAARGHLRTAARAGLLLGHIDVNTGRLTEGLERYARAALASETARDLDGVVNARISTAQTLSLLGEHSRSWAMYVESLAKLPHIRSSRIRGALLDAAGLAALDAGLPELALHFGATAAAAAEREGTAASATEAHLRLARAFSLSGESRPARSAIAAARAWNARTSPLSAAFNEARAAVAEAELVSAHQPAAAIPLFDRAIAFYERSARRIELPPALLARGRVHRRLGDLESARRDFAAGLAVVEELTGSLRDVDLDISYLDAIFGLVDEQVAFAVDERRDPDAAFAIAERWRGRGLWPTREAPGRVLRPRDVSPALDDGTSLVFFYQLSDRLLSWYITSSAVTFRATSVDALALAADVQRLAAAVASGAGDPETSGVLHARLLGPHRAQLERARTLLICPDVRLAGLPFAALRDPRTGALLVQTHASALVPSVALFVDAPVAPTARGPLRAQAIAVRDGMDVSGRRLPLLSGGEQEARRIAALYPHSALVVGPEATPARFLAALASHDIVHFAGHGIVNNRRPGLSRLVMAPDAASGRPAALYAENIVCRGSCRARTVVLASCETAAGRPSISEGTMSLARPFVVAGVEAVVATLWPVQDDTVTEVFVGVHEQLAVGARVEDALRTAQLRLLSGSGKSGDWAAVQVVLGRRRSLGVSQVQRRSNEAS